MWQPVRLGHQWLLECPDWTAETLHRILRRGQYPSSLGRDLYMPYHLQTCPDWRSFQESPLAVQILVNHEECDLASLALCKSLLLITVANTATCTSWLKKQHMLWSYKCRHEQNDLIKGTLAHQSIQHCSAICSWKNSEQDQAQFCGPGEPVERKQQLGNRRRFGTWNWAWGYRWALSEVFSSLSCSSCLFKDKKAKHQLVAV